MQIKTIVVFMSGVLITLILSGIGWYFYHRVQPLPQAEAGKEEMPGMPMAGSPQAEKVKGMGDQSDLRAGLAQAAVMVTPARRQLIGVKTDTVQERALETVVRAVGTVAYDERRIRQINLRISGWITKLSVDYTGKFVKEGDPLFSLYSPDLVSTQEEYLLARRTLDRVKASPMAHIRVGAEAQVEAARNRLLLWGLTNEQIAELEQREKPRSEITIYSPIDGIVTKKTALQGLYVTPEMNLYEIADLSTVWIYADLYEYEIPWIRVGQEATVTLTAYPGEQFRGRVIYIYPYLNTETRTIKVRMELHNPNDRLKPGMYGNVEVRVKAGKKLAIPKEAVLDSGTRKLVFIDRGGGMYEPREVKLGPAVDDYYEVRDGVKAGDRVVTSGTFLIDSESKLMAATSMMGMLGMGGIKMEQGKMGEMEMGGMKGKEGMEEMKGMEGKEKMEMEKMPGMEK